MQGRIRAFDWLRGIAVLFMIQCHALTLVATPLRESVTMARLLYFDGLVAPSFIFSAGFSLALVQIRGARSGSRLKRVRKTLRRLGELLFVATLVNWAWFPIFREPKWMFRIDILQCIGFSLLLALPLLALLAPRPRWLAAVSLVLALIVFLIAPLTEHTTGFFQPLLNGHGVPDAVFPLVPWAGYVYLGASAGAVAATADWRGLAKWMALLLGIGIGVRALKPVFLAIYPPHQYWVTDPANHAERWIIVCAVMLILLWIESRVGERFLKSAPVRFINVFGTSSMAAYFFHEMVLYFHLFGFSFDAVWGKKCGWAKYSVLAAALIAITLLLSWLTDKAYPIVNKRLDAAFDWVHARFSRKQETSAV